ncbi:acetoacetate decarboxylase family protein [Microbacterium sp.]|uniref:acetoacetate decarboxylase family protein n=1 Tax=Microbacterium sp. TaxID=51671 RepID=UPI003C75C055
MDAAVVLPVSFEGQMGGTFFYEYEDNHLSVSMGREAWGYPKAYAKCDMIQTEKGVRARVWDYETNVFSVDVTFCDTVDDGAWADVQLYPQLQTRFATQLAGPGFSLLEVVSRDPSVDYVAKQRFVGRAEVEIGRLDLTNRILDGGGFEIKEVLGAELRIGDYRSTPENGVPKVVRKLV